jgi:hypothetical protein
MDRGQLDGSMVSVSAKAPPVRHDRSRSRSPPRGHIAALALLQEELAGELHLTIPVDEIKHLAGVDPTVPDLEAETDGYFASYCI